MKPKLRLSLKKQEQLSDYISAIAWSPQTEMLAACSAVGELTLYPVHSPCFPLQPARGVSLNTLAFSSQGDFLATAGQAGSLEVWNLQRSSLPKRIVQQEYAAAWIDTLKWHPQKPLLAYAVGREVYLLDMTTQQIQAKFPFDNSSVLDLAWHPQQDYLAVSGHGSVKIWNFNDPSSPPEVLEVPGASLTVAWSADGRYLASGNLDRTLTILEWETPPPWLMQGFPGKVRELTWSQEKSPLLAAACLDGVALWWQDQKHDQWQNAILQYHEGFVRALSFHPKQPLLASGGDDGLLVLWEKETAIKTLKSPSGGFSCVCWQHQGNYLAAGISTGEILIWEFLLENQQKRGFG